MLVEFIKEYRSYIGKFIRYIVNAYRMKGAI